MMVLIHNPNQPLIVMTKAGQQVRMQAAEYRDIVAYVQPHLWLPVLPQNTVLPSARTQQSHADGESVKIKQQGGVQNE